MLSLITYALYMLLYIVTDEQAREFYFGGYPLWGYVVDAATTFVCIFLFVQLSIFYSKGIYRRFMSFAHPYRSLLVYSLALFIMNTLTAYLLSLLTGYMFNLDGLPFLQVQHLYVYSILATFISNVYVNAHYLYSYMEAEAAKRRLETEAMQAKLNALKQQVDPHFMFNNFCILTELIMEDSRLAVKFLGKLSKVYRYIIQNYDRDTVPLADELAFLDSYLYLMYMRYGDSIVVSIGPEMRDADGSIPPASLQIVVENALKHNRFSRESPLMIAVSVADGCLVVRNALQPLASAPASTGIGQRNIAERHALIGGRRPSVERTEFVYTVRLPIISGLDNDREI